MITVDFKCENNEEMTKLRDRICEALVGSPSFINGEIAVCDIDETDFCMLIGNTNGHNLECELTIPL